MGFEIILISTVVVSQWSSVFVSHQLGGGWSQVSLVKRDDNIFVRGRMLTSFWVNF